MKRIHKSLIMVCALLLWFLFLLWLMPCSDIKEYAYRSEYEADGTLVIAEGETYIQEFDSTVTFNSIELFLDNSDCSRTDRTLHMVLYYNGIELEETELHTGIIAPETLEWELNEMSGGFSRYRLSIEVLDNNGEDESVAFRSFASRTTGAQSICMNRYRVYTNYFAIFAICVMLLIILVWGVMHYAPIVHTAPMLIFGMGLVMMAVMSPLSGPDEQFHYLSAYKLSNIMMGTADVEAVDRNYYIDDALTEHYNKTGNFIAVMEGWKDSYYEDQGYRNIADEHVSNLMYPVPYIFSACGIVLGRLLRLGFMKTYYLGRLFNLLAYTFLTTVAVRVTPKLKELFLILALLPINLQQSVSYSYDMIIIAVSLLFFAWFLRAMERESGADWKDIVSMALMVLLFSGTKLVYFVLGIFVIIVYNKWSRRRAADKVVLGVALGGVALPIAFLAYRYIRTMGVYVSQKYTVGDALHSPVTFIRVVCSSLLQNGGKWIEELSGRWLAGMTVVIPQIFIMGFSIIILLAAARNKKDTVDLTITENSGILAILWIGFFLTALALWTDTDFGADTIGIIQGRYFMPFVIPFVLAVVSLCRVTWHKDKRGLVTAYLFLQTGVVVCVLNQITI